MFSENFRNQFAKKINWESFDKKQEEENLLLMRLKNIFGENKARNAKIFMDIRDTNSALRKDYTSNIEALDLSKSAYYVLNTLSKDFIKDNLDNINWEYFCTYQILSEETIKELKEEVVWWCVYEYQNLSEGFIKELINEGETPINFRLISAYQKLSESFIEEFKDDVCWREISQYQTLSEEFILKFKDRVDWYKISCFQQLSEEFIINNQDKIDWSGISRGQKLSKQFVERNKSKIDWQEICRNPCLTFDLAKNFKEQLYNVYYINNVLRNHRLDEDIVSFLSDRFHKYEWSYLLKDRIVSEDFISRFHDKINWNNIMDNQYPILDYVVNNKESFVL